MKFNASWIHVYAIMYLVWCQFHNSIWLHDLDDRVIRTLCVSLQDGREKLDKSVVVDDVCLCFWVCVSGKGNAVVESSSGTLIQSREGSASVSVCGRSLRWSEFRFSLIAGSKHMYIRFQRKSMYVFWPLHSTPGCMHMCISLWLLTK